MASRLIVLGARPLSARPPLEHPMGGQVHRTHCVPNLAQDKSPNPRRAMTALLRRLVFVGVLGSAALLIPNCATTDQEKASNTADQSTGAGTRAAQSGSSGSSDRVGTSSTGSTTSDNQGSGSTYGGSGTSGSGSYGSGTTGSGTTSGSGTSSGTYGS